MKPTAWNFALRAASKVAFATSLVGCGGVVAIEPSNEKQDPDTKDEPSQLKVSMPDPRETCAAPAGGWQTYDPATFECCIVAVEEQLTEGSLAFADPVTEEIDGCCTQIVTPNYDALWSGQPLAVDAPDDVIAGCCDLKHGNASCTPWGPPAPPAMDPHEGTPWIAMMEAALLDGVA
jgi:hypothetical protein